jgi:DNA-binding LacI/PurR family transcriptional regulator
VKLSDIAQLAGVSVTTASYVINGKAEQQRISSTTVERVRAVVEEHGFTPNPQAAGLRSRHTRTLGLSFRTSKTRVMRALPSNWNKAPGPVAINC